MLLYRPHLVDKVINDVYMFYSSTLIVNCQMNYHILWHNVIANYCLIDSVKHEAGETETESKGKYLFWVLIKNTWSTMLMANFCRLMQTITGFISPFILW